MDIGEPANLPPCGPPSPSIVPTPIRPAVSRENVRRARAASIAREPAAFKLRVRKRLLARSARLICRVASRRRAAAVGMYQNGTRAQQQTHQQHDSNSTFCHCGISSWCAKGLANGTRARFLFAHWQGVLRLLVCGNWLFLFQFPKTEQK